MRRQGYPVLSVCVCVRWCLSMCKFSWCVFSWVSALTLVLRQWRVLVCLWFGGVGDAFISPLGVLVFCALCMSSPSSYYE